MIYDDKVLEPAKDLSVEAPSSSSSSTSFSYDLKSYLNELVGRIFANNMIREERIMAHIDIVTKVSEESWEKLKGKVSDEMQNSESQVIS